MAFVMATMPVSLCAAITGASQVGVIKSLSRGAVWTITRLEMLDVAVRCCKVGFAVTAQVLLFCLQRCLDRLIRGCITSKIVPRATTPLPW